MPKMKTHCGAKKRFRLTGTGKVMREQAGGRHLLEHKSSQADPLDRQRRRGVQAGRQEGQEAPRQVAEPTHPIAWPGSASSLASS